MASPTLQKRCISWLPYATTVYPRWLRLLWSYSWYYSWCHLPAVYRSDKGGRLVGARCPYYELGDISVCTVLVSLCFVFLDILEHTLWRHPCFPKHQTIQDVLFLNIHLIHQEQNSLIILFLLRLLLFFLLKLYSLTSSIMNQLKQGALPFASPQAMAVLNPRRSPSIAPWRGSVVAREMPWIRQCSSWPRDDDDDGANKRRTTNKSSMDFFVFWFDKWLPFLVVFFCLVDVY